MDSRDPRSAVERLVGITRRITRVTQIAPFAYLLFLAVLLLAEPLLPDIHVRLVDRLSAIPMYVQMSMLGLGRLLRLCRWFVSACLLPLLPKVVGYVDSFVITLYQEEVVLTNILIGIAYIAFLFVSFRHFFYGREKGTAEILDYYRYKVDRNLCTLEEMESASRLLQENMDMYGTVEDFAKFYNVSETQVRSAINRKLIDKPKRRVYYRFLSFLKVAPKTWRERLHTS